MSTTESAIPPSTNMKDPTIAKVQELYDEDKILEAARLLSSASSSESDNASLKELISSIAVDAQELVDELKTQADGKEWKKQGISKGHDHHTIIYHSVDMNESSSPSGLIRMRLETPIAKSMVVPILSVLNETQLYQNWLPSFHFPRLNLKKVDLLRQTSRASQIFQVLVEFQRPILPREFIFSSFGFDDIDANNTFGISLKTLEVGDENGFVKEPEEDVVRATYKGGFVFYDCPSDHEALVSLKKHKEHEKKKKEKKNKGRGKKSDKSDDETTEQGDEDDEEMVLMALCFTQDFHMKFIPQPLINFILKIAIGTAWNMFLQTCTDVKDGKRPDHAAAIEEKRATFYDWIDERIAYLFKKRSSTT